MLEIHPLFIQSWHEFVESNAGYQQDPICSATIILQGESILRERELLALE